MSSIHPEVAKRRQLLTNKFKHNNIDKKEAYELKQILEKEKETAVSLGDLIAVFGILFLLALLVDYLDENKSKKKRL